MLLRHTRLQFACISYVIIANCYFLPSVSFCVKLTPAMCRMAGLFVVVTSFVYSCFSKVENPLILIYSIHRKIGLRKSGFLKHRFWGAENGGSAMCYNPWIMHIFMPFVARCLLFICSLYTTYAHAHIPTVVEAVQILHVCWTKTYAIFIELSCRFCALPDSFFWFCWNKKCSIVSKMKFILMLHVN